MGAACGTGPRGSSRLQKGYPIMALAEPYRVGYVVKRYPRYSETFVVREILAHERAGLEIEIFSLRPSDDTHFQDLIARVRGPVNHLYFPSPGMQPDVLTAT